jgi:hypothetical protein
MLYTNSKGASTDKDFEIRVAKQMNEKYDASFYRQPYFLEAVEAYHRLFNTYWKPMLTAISNLVEYTDNESQIYRENVVV